MKDNHKLLLDNNLELNVKSGNGDICKLTIEQGRYPIVQHISDYWFFEGDNSDTLEVEDIDSPHEPKYILSGNLNSRLFSSKHFKYVTQGEANTNKIKEFVFTFPEMASYFNKDINIYLKQNGNLEGNINTPHLKAKVTIENQPVNIELIQQNKRLSYLPEGEIKFTPSIGIKFIFTQTVTIEEVEKFYYKSKNLLNWITGYPIRISKIELFDERKNSSLLYIASAKIIDNYDLSFPSSFMLSNKLKEHFQSICNNVFSKNIYEFEMIWSKTIEVYNFHGLIEHEIMLYTAILEKYCDYKINKLELGNSINDSVYNETIKYINNLINNDKHLSNSSLDDVLLNLKQEDELKQLLPNKSTITFKQKIKTYLNYIGKYVTEVFITSEDLHLIKSIRDRAAHGELETNNIDDVSIVYWKLKMLITYLIFKDFGLTDDNFLELIGFTHHPLAINCKTNQYLVDKKLGKTNTLPVSESDFKALSSKMNLYCVISRNGNLYEFNKELSEKLKYYFTNDIEKNKINSLSEYVQSLLGDSKLKSKYINNVYIKWKSKIHNLHSVILIDTDRKFKELSIND